MQLVLSGNPLPRYIIVSPAKDEERYVELTLRSVIAQTLKPSLWIIVDDGSKDRTSEIVGKYTEAHSFIRLVNNPHVGARKPGSAVIRAFNCGCEAIGETDYDFIVKLDCDLSFEQNYFEKLLGRFMADRWLGIASGIYLEMDKAGIWQEVSMPPYHAAGACKVVRRKCFEEIGGFIASVGWDTVDEIRAISRGWKTYHFRNLQMKHHKPEGSSLGAIRTNIMHGEIYYLTGGSKIFFLIKFIHRMKTRPYVLSAMALSWGYIKAASMRKRLLVTKEEASSYKGLLRERLWMRAKNIVGLS